MFKRIIINLTADYFSSSLITSKFEESLALSNVDTDHTLRILHDRLERILEMANPVKSNSIAIDWQTLGS